MSKKILAALVTISVIANIFLAVMLYINVNNKSRYESEFLREISFAIQRFEEYEQEPEEPGYMVGVAHLYSAWSALTSIGQDEWTYKQAEDFRRLWNNGAIYPQSFQENIGEIIEILGKIKADHDFNDTNALQELVSFNLKITKS